VIICGIETSCDDTSVAIITENQVKSSVISAQAIHELFGGVVPELASREHLKHVDRTFAEAIEKAHVSITEIDLISVTKGPGLAGALLVGLNFAKGLNAATGIPFIGINHLEGHIASNYINNPNWKPPFINLLVSGGHSQLIYVKDWTDFELLGSSLDDAVGEAFDKTAKLLGLDYPGGPIIDKRAAEGNATAINFPMPYIKNKNLDFSYSGLKTAVSQYVKENPSYNLADVCASFQRVAIDALVIKLIRASKQCGLKRISIAGGVSANSYLRQKISDLQTDGFEINCPDLAYCTDNGAMIAKAGLIRYKKNISGDSLSVSVKPTFPITHA
jgi:N6-L-threonylcarbamoyladenine synthase